VLSRTGSSGIDDVILVYFLAPKGKWCGELGIHRFVKEANEPCLKSYQFSMRIRRPGSAKEAAATIRQNKDKWIDLLGHLSQPIYESGPRAAAGSG